MKHTDTLIAALRILSRDIYCEDGVATACIADAANHIERMRDELVRLQGVVCDEDAESISRVLGGKS
ncbi:MAG: hypothetical protein RLZZ21_1378 [Planctomycetota bacterium]